MELTTIQISKEIRDKLKNLRTTNRESYNEILIRLITEREVKNGGEKRGEGISS